MTVAEYRAVPAKSYSMMKDFVTKGRRHFHKKYVLKEKIKEESNPSMRIGDMVDCYRFTPKDFDEKFLVSNQGKLPTGKGAIFVEKLFELHQQGGEFMANAQQAYNHAELTKPSFEVYMEKFEGSPLEDMYLNLIEAESKIVVSLDEVAISERIVSILSDHPLIGQIFKRDGHNQLPVVFEYNGETFKALFDRVTLDHSKKIIKPYDLKVTFEDEKFGYNFLKNKYYIQQGVYEEAIKVWRDRNYPDYEIDPFRFIVVNSSSINQPLVYELTPYSGDFQFGFETERGSKIKGVTQIQEEINWHIRNDIWDVSKENYQKSNFIKQII